jgi:hypothetical protein
MKTVRTDSKASHDTRPAAAPKPGEADPALQGEGNYTAARRHRKSVKKFVESGRVQDAAREAAPDSDAVAQELERAEEAGLSHARK